MERGKAYSQDLREKVLEAYQSGQGSMNQIAQRFMVSRNWVNNIVQRYRKTGTVAEKPRIGAKPKLSEQHYAVVEEIVAQHKDATLVEIATKVYEQTGVQVSKPTICRVLQKLKLTRKKNATRSQAR